MEATIHSVPVNGTSVSAASAANAMTRLTLRDYQHKAAIATNNDGVTLLGRGYYREALDTFKDSMKLMKSAKGRSATSVSTAATTADHKALSVRDVPDTNVTDPGHAIRDVQTRLHRSWHTCAASSTLQGRAQPPNMYANGGRRPVLQIISSQCTHECQSLALHCCTFHSSLYVAFPMTIDPIEPFTSTADTAATSWADHRTEDANDAHDLEFQSAILLYNYGIAYHCLAVEAGARHGNRALETLLQEKTFRIYQMVDALLHKLSTAHARHGNVAFPSWHCLLLNTFLTYNLIQACIQRDVPLSYRQQHCHTLDQYLCLLASHHAVVPWTDQCLAAAA